MTNIIITLPINPKKQVHVEKYLKDGLIVKLELQWCINLIIIYNFYRFVENDLKTLNGD